jgi:hypothetical protein
MKRGWMAPVAAFFSSWVAIVCPLCIPALGGFLASVGLGFAVKIQFLQPFLIVLLCVAVTNLMWSAKQHGRWILAFSGLTGAVLIYLGRYLWFSQLAMWIGAFVLILSSIFNLRIKGGCEKCS